MIAGNGSGGLMSWLSTLGQAPPAPMPEAFQQIDQPADYQPYIFWAYACVCLLLFIFTLWSVIQLRAVGRKVDDLTKRYDEAHAQEGQAR